MTVAVGEQAQLLNTETKAIDPYWVDPAQPLLVPVNPLHFAAHRYQIILERLDKMAVRNPAQFNSGNYIQIMEKLEKLWDAINKGQTVNEVLDKGSMASGGNTLGSSANGSGKSISMDT